LPMTTVPLSGARAPDVSERSRIAASYSAWLRMPFSCIKRSVVSSTTDGAGGGGGGATKGATGATTTTGGGGGGAGGGGAAAGGGAGATAGGGGGTLGGGSGGEESVGAGAVWASAVAGTRRANVASNTEMDRFKVGPLPGRHSEHRSMTMV
jgi:hypothetical protein